MIAIRITPESACTIQNGDCQQNMPVTWECAYSAGWAGRVTSGAAQRFASVRIPKSAFRYVVRVSHGFGSRSTSGTSKIDVNFHDHLLYHVESMLCAESNHCTSGGSWPSGSIRPLDINSTKVQSSGEPIMIYDKYNCRVPTGSNSTCTYTTPPNARSWVRLHGPSGWQCLCRVCLASHRELLEARQQERSQANQPVRH